MEKEEGRPSHAEEKPTVEKEEEEDQVVQEEEEEEAVIKEDEEEPIVAEDEGDTADAKEHKANIASLFGSDEEDDDDDDDFQAGGSDSEEEGSSKRRLKKKSSAKQKSKSSAASEGADESKPRRLKKKAKKSKRASKKKQVFGGGAALGDNEEKALEEASDAYDSGEEQVANSEDENFIDQEGDSDNEDYRNQVQKFEDEVPVEKVRKPSKNVVTKEDLDAARADEVQKFLERMIEATFSDRRAVEKGKPALMKLKMLKEVRHMMESHPHQPFLLRGTPTDPNSLTLLPVLNDWLSCKHGLPVLQIRTELLPALKNLPVMEVLGPSGLAPTGLGKTLLELAKHPKETKANKRLLQQIMESWMRPVLNTSTHTSANISTILEHRKRHMEKTEQLRQLEGAKFAPSFDPFDASSREEGAETSGKAKAVKRKGLGAAFAKRQKVDSSGASPAARGPTIESLHARRPTPVDFNYSSIRGVMDREEMGAEAAEARPRSSKPREDTVHAQLKKLMQMRKRNKNKNPRALGVSIEGRSVLG